MPHAALSPTGLTNLISVAAAPVVLITATSILLSAFIAKYSGIAAQIRALTTEFRQAQTSRARRVNLRQQLALFRRRITAIWAASISLSLALISFLTTVLTAIFVQREAHLFLMGAASILLGLALIGVAVGLELYEIRLARLTIAGELADVFAEDDEEPSTRLPIDL